MQGHAGYAEKALNLALMFHRQLDAPVMSSDQLLKIAEKFKQFLLENQ